MNIVQLQCGEGDFNSSPFLRLAYSASLGHEALATMVNVGTTVSALVSLLEHPVQQTATVITPGGGVICGGSELVGAWLLERGVGQQ